jgi:hypothetical protein
MRTHDDDQAQVRRWLEWLAEGAPSGSPPANTEILFTCPECKAVLRCRPGDCKNHHALEILISARESKAVAAVFRGGPRDRAFLRSKDTGKMVLDLGHGFDSPDEAEQRREALQQQQWPGPGQGED